MKYAGMADPRQQMVIDRLLRLRDAGRRPEMTVNDVANTAKCSVMAAELLMDQMRMRGIVRRSFITQGVMSWELRKDGAWEKAS